MNVTDEIIDRQLPAISKEVRYCTRCVISNQRPRITFDENGVCSACRYSYEKHNVIDWKDRERQLIELLDKYRSKDGSYDVLVPGSGGKDSAVVAHKLKHQYGMHPLTATWAPFVYTDIGWKNYIRFKDSGFDNILGFPDGKLHRKLALLAFDLLGDPFDPFVYGQMAFPFHLAAKFNIPLIFYGENGEVEYGGTSKNEDKPGEPIEDWSTLYYKGQSVDRLVEHGLKRGVFTSGEVQSGSFELYRPPAVESLQRVDVQMHWWSYYHKWVPQEHYYYSVEHTGFCANPERSEGTYSKYASLDDQLDGFHYYMAFIKFGIGRATADAAHEIRDGHLTRDEGVALVQRYDGEFPKKYFPAFLNYVGITGEEFWYVTDKFRPEHIWKKIDGKWTVRQQVQSLTSDSVALPK